LRMSNFTPRATYLYLALDALSAIFERFSELPQGIH
jgi:hypothetical protein